LRFPTWESRNARVDRGIVDKSKIDGLSGVGKMQEDWDEYHDEDWPGVEQAIEWSCPYLDAEGTPTIREDTKSRENPSFRSDLHTKWYKRRVGIMPPQGADKWRPFTVGEVEQAYKRDVGQVRLTPEALGVDIADKTDTTKAIGLHEQKAIVEYDSQKDLPTQQSELVEKIQNWPELEGCVDGIGRGAQIAQELANRYPGFREFGNNEIPTDDDYRHKWEHGLYLIGEWLRAGGSFEDKNLYEALKIAAREIEFSRNHLKSRGKVIEATAKDRVKKALGRSPDTLDALAMALYAREASEPETDVPLAW